MRKELFITIILNIIFAGGVLKAQSTLPNSDIPLQVNTITTAVPFLQIVPDGRAAGMGDAGAATSPDAYSLHHNSSKLAFLENEFGFTLSYVPWLPKLAPDMNLTFLNGYKKLNDQQTLAGGLRYFSLGSIKFTDATGQPLRDFTPAEFTIDLAFAQKLSKNFSLGIAARYINSNLTGGTSLNGAQSKAAQAVGVDVTAYYQSNKFKTGEGKGFISAGAAITNIGNKISYNNLNNEEDFLPTNLKIGASFTYEIDEYNSISISADANKLLVPTPPLYAKDNRGNFIRDSDGNLEIAVGKDNRDVGPIEGIFQSFSDAPGAFYDENDEIQTIGKGKEELREINYSLGLEYLYLQRFAVRGGFFYEHPTKGNRRFFTLGAGVKINLFQLDISYLIAMQSRYFTGQHPLANTLRFSLTFNFDKNGSVVE